MNLMVSKITENWLFAQQLVQHDNNENIQAPHF